MLPSQCIPFTLTLRLNKIRSNPPQFNPTPKILDKLYLKKENLYVFLEVVQSLPDSGCTLSLKSSQTCQELLPKPFNTRNKIILINTSKDEMQMHGCVILHLKAPKGREVRIRVLVTEANQESFMVSWSDLQRFVILSYNSPEVLENRSNKLTKVKRIQKWIG